ncbi:MAG: fused MFS/spermidine synthase [Polyangiaceae bacterium]|nr:fused MFS/spermidine synthase [Polyangiaceae bacterium]
MTPEQRRSLIILFAFGGWSSLLYEVLWLRLFSSVLGSTTQSMSAVVTAFLLGSGIGALVFGKIADRSERLLRLYGKLELGTALTAALAFVLFFSAEGLSAALFRALDWSVFRWLLFAIAFTTVALPAMLIGGGLPVLTRAVLASGDSARVGLGRLYAAHTVGAALGALTSAQLVASFGYDVSYGIATVASATVGGVALWVGRHSRFAVEADPPAATLTRGSNLVPAAIACSGFAALGMEVVWFRLMDFVWRGTLLSFALILFIYLLGLASGSAFVARRRAHDDGWLARLQLALTLLLPCTLAMASLGAAGEAERARTALVWLAIVFGTTFLFGMTLPLAAELYVRRESSVGRDVGRVYAANLIGAVCGAFCAGFLLLPTLGTHRTVLLLSLLSASSALLAWRAGVGRRRLGLPVAVVVASILGLGVSAGPWLRRYVERMVSTQDARLVHLQESELQILSVLEQPRGRRELRGGPHVSGSTDPVRRQTQKLQSHLPMLLHPQPRRVLEIGYGVGELLRTILRYEPDHVDLVELDPQMIDVANEWFTALNARASEDPRVKVHTLDGRAFLRLSQARYDVVMSDSMFLDSEGALRLYTIEHFRATRARLAEGGLVLVWLPLNLDDRAARTVLRTFREVFPQTLVWVPLLSNQVESFLIGFQGEAKVDGEQFRQRYARYAAPDLEHLGWGDPIPALVSFRAAPADLPALLGDAGVNRDRKPVLDFMRDEPTFGLRDALLRVPTTALERHMLLTPAKWSAVRQAKQAEARVSVPLRAIARTPTEQRHADAPRLREALLDARRLAPGHPAIESALGRLAAERAVLNHEPEAFSLALEHDPYNFRANEHFLEQAARRGDRDAARAHLSRMRLLEPYSTRARELAQRHGL